jgi:hypothetical protein
MGIFIKLYIYLKFSKRWWNKIDINKLFLKILLLEKWDLEQMGSDQIKTYRGSSSEKLKGRH